MIIDTSAILAILFAEAEAPAYASAIAGADVRKISAVNLLEAAIVIDNQLGAAAGRQLDAFMEQSAIAVVPATEAQVRIARQAYLDFGKGNHPAGLNFGDCFAYALAKSTAEPLLFKGDDFSRTDIVAALTSANVSDDKIS
jgi:ribonuclease VapC